MKRKLTAFAAAFIYTAFQACLAGQMTIESSSQEFKDSEKKIYLEGNVKVKTDDGSVISPRASAEVNPADNKVKNIEFIENAYSFNYKDGRKHEIKAQVLSVSLLNKYVSAEGNTITSITESDKPIVIITADKQEYFKNDNIMKAHGGVNIIYKNVKTFSNSAEVYLDAGNDIKKIILSGSARLEQNGSSIKADKLIFDNVKQEAEAFGSVYTDAVSDDGKRIKVWSNYQYYDKIENFITASGSTKVEYENYKAHGPKVSVYSDKKTGKLNEAVFFGRSSIENDGRKVEADKITITMNPKDFKAEGNVKSTLQNMSY